MSLKEIALPSAVTDHRTADRSADRTAPEPSGPGSTMVEDFFARTVPRKLVHRSAISEVLVTACRAVASDSFTVGAQLPRAHSFYGPVAARWHDPLLVAEAIRQAGLVVCHQELGIPLDHQFLMHELAYDIDLNGLLVADRPADLVLAVEVRDLRHRARTVSGARLEMTVHRDGRWLGTGGARFDCVSPAAYSRMRSIGGCPPEAAGAPTGTPAPALPTPLAPAAVGRDRQMDVVLSPATGPAAWLLRADRSHPVLFDHPVDHAPGMLLAEAARQASAALLGRPEALPAAFRIDYLSYVELDAPCVVRAQVLEQAGDLAQVRVTVAQGGEVAVRGRVTVVTGTGA
ncbi:A-factor biosynthesis hotdog protein [Streptomyces sp. 846.5]|nr:A-factor biosynthesis hotdog protein [Streptomyces sp. 846.5]